MVPTVAEQQQMEEQERQRKIAGELTDSEDDFDVDEEAQPMSRADMRHTLSIMTSGEKYRIAYREDDRVCECTTILRQASDKSWYFEADDEDGKRCAYDFPVRDVEYISIAPVAAVVY